jgi:DNA polymerase/3'-5' exonuclease PolX
MLHTPATTDIDNNDADLLSRNKELADVLALIGSYYNMARDTYRAKSFINASSAIAEYPIAILSGAQARSQINGIGESIATVIDEFIQIKTQEELGAPKGQLVGRLRELGERFSDQKTVIDTFRSIYGIGPVTAVKFYKQNFRTLDDLWNKANLTNAQKVGILWRDHINLRIYRNEMDVINNTLGAILDKYGIKWNIAGSYRRNEPSSGDIDVLVESRADLNMEGLISILRPILPADLAIGHTKYMGILRLSDQYNGHRIDIRLVDANSYAAALMYFTGSQRFNILMRQRALDMGMTLNEYGLYYNDGSPPPLILSENDIFEYLRVNYLAPVDRTRTINALPIY